MTLWAVRHAQPLIAAGICYGQLDVAADADATRLCVKALANMLPLHTRLICSPLQRCEQLTPVLLALRPDLALNSDPDLMEMNFGEWEGRTWAAIAPEELQAWTADFAHYRAGRTGETASEVMHRVAAAFDRAPADANTLWITHAGVIRAASLIATGTRQIARADQWPLAAPAYGQWCEIKLKSV